MPGDGDFTGAAAAVHRAIEGADFDKQVSCLKPPSLASDREGLERLAHQGKLEGMAV